MHRGAAKRVARGDGSTKPQPAQRSSEQRQGGERSIGRSLKEYGRGVAGGLLFSLPFLYTMEVWWAGHTMHPRRLAIGLLVTFILLLGYNRYAGLRRDASLAEVAIDSVEELGIGLLLAAAILWLMGQVSLDMPAGEIAGKIVVEAMTVAIGVSVGTAQLGGAGNDAQGEEDAGGMAGDDAPVDFVGQIVLAFCGAVLIAGNVAPTEEIVMLAVEASALRQIGLAIVSIALATVILFYSDFRSAQRYAPSDGVLAAIFGSVITYAIALVAGALMLWFFGSFEGYGPATWLAEIVVLGVAASLGASAGRLLLQTSAEG
jgi:putative integral membrane protein (TIGR02587 family)